MDEFNAQALANTAWTLSTVAQLDAQLFTALAKTAERRAGEFKPQGLANTAWAFATMGQPDAQMFTALARNVEQRLGEFKAQELANTAWALATVGPLDAQLFASLARMAEQRVGEFKPQDVANTAWALTESAEGVLRVAEAKRGGGGVFEGGCCHLDSYTFFMQRMVGYVSLQNTFCFRIKLKTKFYFRF